jgi:hypothetical protein
VDWARRLERIEKEKARERQSVLNGKTELPQNFAEAKGETNQIVADASGFGNKETYRQAKYIADHADDELIRQLDEKTISIHAAYQQLKKKAEEAERRAREAEQKAAELYDRLEEEMNKPPQAIFENAKAFAEAERTYRMELAKEIIRLRAEGMQATLISDVARGNVAELKYKRDLAEGLYRSSLESAKALQAELSGLQSIFKQFSEM